MLNASLCDCSDAHIVVAQRITVVRQGEDAAEIIADRNNKEIVFKNCTPIIKIIKK